MNRYLTTLILFYNEQLLKLIEEWRALSLIIIKSPGLPFALNI